jgi:3-oxoacyl-[acyl-carrier-protein] synthase II
MGEGAGALVLETLESAQARGAKIYCEIVGGSVTSDAFHITAPDPGGSGAARAILMALEQADSKPSDVEHINAHATSTPVGDIAEYTAIKRAFKDHTDDLVVSATKSATGHLLGGAGAIEAIFTILTLTKQQVPPTINLDSQDPAIPLNVPTKITMLSRPDALAISNSFGFGGHNAVLAFRNL